MNEESLRRAGCDGLDVLDGFTGNDTRVLERSLRLRSETTGDESTTA